MTMTMTTPSSPGESSTPAPSGAGVNPLDDIRLDTSDRIVNRHIRWDWLSFMLPNEPKGKYVKALCGKTTQVKYSGIPGVTRQTIVFYEGSEPRWGWCPRCCKAMIERYAEVLKNYTLGPHLESQARVAVNIGLKVLGQDIIQPVYHTGPQVNHTLNKWARLEPCYLCQARHPYNAQLDHIIPRSLGGFDEWWNRAYVCSSCNSKKGTRLPHELGEVFPDVWLPKRFVQSIT